MPTPQMFSRLGLYGDRTYFQEALAEGYDQITFVTGPWVGEQRIVGGFALRKEKFPAANVRVFYHPKQEAGGSTMRAAPQKESFSPAGFKKFQTQFKLSIVSWVSLRKLLDDWKV